VLCPLPLFHVFAAYPVMMSASAAGSHVVLPTPQGYRGDGVFDNFWKLIERHKATFVITVPTALAALMQRPVMPTSRACATAFRARPRCRSNFTSGSKRPPACRSSKATA
jgi:fatty-acyl-CoA synthase